MTLKEIMDRDSVKFKNLVLAESGRKTCYRCKEPKPLDKFGCWRKAKDGLNPLCKECVNADHKKWREENPERYQAQRKSEQEKKNLRYDPLTQFVKALKDRYKMTIEQWDEMMLNQGGMCAICDKEAFLVVDHDHATGKVRQLLCRGCNCALGNLKDSIELIAKAGEYLKRHNHDRCKI